jgi:hypothetical protein
MDFQQTRRDQFGEVFLSIPIQMASIKEKPDNVIRGDSVK